jgi:prevent-host-death family protein
MSKAVYGLRAAERKATYQVGSRDFQTAEDIIPIAELKANMSEIVRGLDQRPRPLVVTLNGKPAAVVMSPREYDLLSYRARFVEAVSGGLADAQAGRTVDGDEAVAELLREIAPKKPRRGRVR